MPRTASTTPKTTTAAKKPAAKKAPVTDPKEVLETPVAGGTPNAPAVGDDDQEQTTEEHDNGQNDSTPTFEDLELIQLRRELAEYKAREEAEAAQERATASHYEPVDESTLSPEQIQIRSLQDQLAKARGKEIDKAEEVYEENVEGGILVHFLEDGLSSNGRNFYRGQEVTFGPEAYADTLDRNGNSWLNMSEEEQYARWDEVKFRRGPWPGRRTYEEDALKNQSITEQAPLVRI